MIPVVIWFKNLQWLLQQGIWDILIYFTKSHHEMLDLGMTECEKLWKSSDDSGSFDEKSPTLTYWGGVMHIRVSNLIIIGSYNGLLPGQCQAIIRTSAGILLIRPLWTNFDEILIEIHTFSLKKFISKQCLENSGHFVSASMC